MVQHTRVADRSHMASRSAHLGSVQNGLANHAVVYFVQPSSSTYPVELNWQADCVVLRHPLLLRGPSELSILRGDSVCIMLNISVAF